jgi:hypothetical protein
MVTGVGFNDFVVEDHVRERRKGAAEGARETETLRQKKHGGMHPEA